LRFISEKRAASTSVPEFARLFAGGSEIRTLGPRQKDDAFRDAPKREVDITKAQLALLSTRRTGHRYSVPRVVRGVTRSLFLAQQDDLLASPRSFA
jgi:hypothetical protein